VVVCVGEKGDVLSKWRPVFQGSNLRNQANAEEDGALRGLRAPSCRRKPAPGSVLFVLVHARSQTFPTGGGVRIHPVAANRFSS